METAAYFSPDAVQRRRVAFRAGVKRFEMELLNRLDVISEEHLQLISSLAVHNGNAGALAASSLSHAAAEGSFVSEIRDTIHCLSNSQLKKAVTAAFVAVSGLAPDVDAAEVWDRESLLKRLALLREQVRVLKEELRRQQSRFSDLGTQYSNLVLHTSALKRTIWASLCAIIHRLEEQGETAVASSTMHRLLQEWPSELDSASMVAQRVVDNNAAAQHALMASEDADDAVRRLIDDAVREARLEEAAKQRILEDRLHEVEASLPTRIAEAVRNALEASRNDAALFQRMKSEYERRIDELTDLLEVARSESQQHLEDFKAALTRYSPHAVTSSPATAGANRSSTSGIPSMKARPEEVSSLLASRFSQPEKSLADALVKVEQLKLLLLREKLDHKAEQQALNRTLRSANQRLANYRPEEVVVKEAQEPLIAEMDALKTELILRSQRLDVVSREAQNRHLEVVAQLSDAQTALKASHADIEALQAQCDKLKADCRRLKDLAVAADQHASGTLATDTDLAAGRTETDQRRGNESASIPIVPSSHVATHQRIRVVNFIATPDETGHCVEADLGGVSLPAADSSAVTSSSTSLSIPSSQSLQPEADTSVSTPSVATDPAIEGNTGVSWNRSTSVVTPIQNQVDVAPSADQALRPTPGLPEQHVIPDASSLLPLSKSASDVTATGNNIVHVDDVGSQKPTPSFLKANLSVVRGGPFSDEPLQVIGVAATLPQSFPASAHNTVASPSLTSSRSFTAACSKAKISKSMALVKVLLDVAAAHLHVSSPPQMGADAEALRIDAAASKRDAATQTPHVARNAPLLLSTDLADVTSCSSLENVAHLQLRRERSATRPLSARRPLHSSAPSVRRVHQVPVRELSLLPERLFQ